MQDSWKQWKSDSTSWQNTLTSSHNLQIQWLVVSAHCQEMKIIWPERLDSREHPNWTRVGSHSQLLQGKYGVEIRIESVNRQFSLVGQNFSWMKQVGHRPDRQRVRRQRTGNLWNEDGSVLLLQVDQRLKQNQEDLPLLEGFNTVDPSGQEILYLRALQGHSGRNPIDPSPQDNVFIPNNFIEYFYHFGCAVSLHSITNSGLITGGQNSSRERQTVFFTDVNPTQKGWGKPDMKVNFLWARELSSIIERDDPSWTLSHQAAQHGMLITLGLLKSGNLMNWLKIEQGDLLYSHSTRIDFLLMTIRCVSYTVAEIRNVVKIQIILE